jgi:hypothetical protein
MEILAHRGMWVEKDQRNTMQALIKGLDAGYGIETDVRDLNGRLVISHDMPGIDSAPLDDLLRYYSDGQFSSTLALNIKADGLQNKLHQLLQDYQIRQYFVFDMSIPDTLGYISREMKTFIRRSEVEYHPELTKRAQGVWLDELIEPWIDAETIVQELNRTQAVCIVSGELHGRAHRFQWDQIRRVIDLMSQSDKLMICTDFPEEAERHFR